MEVKTNRYLVSKLIRIFLKSVNKLMKLVQDNPVIVSRLFMNVIRKEK